MTTLNSTKVVWGTASPLPPKGFPPGRIRWKIRSGHPVMARVKTDDGIREFFVNEEEGCWVPVAERGRNAEARRVSDNALTWEATEGCPHVVIFERVNGITVETFEGPDARERAHAAALESARTGDLVEAIVAVRIRRLLSLKAALRKERNGGAS